MTEGIFFFGGGATDDPQAEAYRKVSVGYITANNIIVLLSIFSLVLVLATAHLSASIHRRGTWFAFLGSWLITSIGNILLVGRQIGPPLDNYRGLCLFQAMFIYSSPILNALTALAFILEAYLRATRHSGWPSRTYTISFYVGPVVVYVGVLIEVLVLGVRNPQWVRRDPTGMYCHFSDPISAKITSAIVIAAMLVVILFEILVGVAIYRSWKTRQEFETCKKPASIDFDVTVRFFIFNIGVVFALTFGFWSFIPQTVVNSARLDIALNTLPFLASVMFGTHKDFFRVWFPCCLGYREGKGPHVNNNIP
ncbi:hypothetical protein BJ165DRAFT_620580 [Panaeolus papilionaceus]|nr:hypothetical protein BJ165DRAFT_620580 [Panaeolus papilionaceus]